MRKVILSAIAAFALTAPAAAQAAQQHAAARGVSVTVTYRQARFHIDRDIHVRIRHAGKLVYNATLAGTCASRCTVIPKAIRIRNLQGRPDNVILQLYTGGAHCCSYDEVFSPVAGSSSWGVDSWNFGDPGAALRSFAHGRTQFVTADDRFAYLFTDYAESGMPLEILSFADHHFTDVTRHHPRLIRRDAERWWRAYMQDHRSGRRGLIAAWAADQWNLNHRRHANRILRREVHRHHINRHFVRRLTHYLNSYGY